MSLSVAFGQAVDEGEHQSLEGGWGSASRRAVKVRDC